jgi:hypothetical protein
MGGESLSLRGKKGSAPQVNREELAAMPHSEPIVGDPEVIRFTAKTRIQ